MMLRRRSTSCRLKRQRGVRTRIGTKLDKDDGQRRCGGMQSLRKQRVAR